MRDPELSSESFLRDEILHREPIADAGTLADCDAAAGPGDPVRFVSSGRLTLTLCPSSSDLSSYDRIALEVLSRSTDAVLVGLTLRHGIASEDPDERDISVSGGREVLTPGKWEDLVFPIECFGTYGNPRGWNDIGEIEISFGWERSRTEKGEIEVFIKGLYGESRVLPEGPRLTPRGLEEVLGGDIAGVTTLFEKHGMERTPRSAIHHDERFGPFTVAATALTIPPPHPYPVEHADEIVAGRIMGQSVGRPVPWDANPLGVLEWTHFLNRHHFMRQLVRAGAETGNPEYITVLEEMIRGWIRSNPAPLGSNGGAGPSWETLSAAWRFREWLWIMGIGWRHEAFSIETKALMVRSIWEHARSLMDHVGHPNNWIIVESAALTLAGLCFPEFIESEQWVAIGLERLQTEFARQFFRDGVHFEISPFYHAICLHAMLEVKLVAAVRHVALPDTFGTPLEKCTEYLTALCRPDFTWPALNDSGGATGDFTALMRTAGEIYDRADLSWIGSRGELGMPPERHTHLFPDAGIGAMRSNHGKDAHFLVFRAGPPGAAHVHWDTLSLEVSAYGRPRLVDPGITAYAPDPLTAHYRSAGAHNTILIDGKGVDGAGFGFPERVRPAGTNFHHSANAELDILSGMSRGPWESIYGDCSWIRTVVFVTSDYWIVRDIVLGTADHETTTCWQFMPGRVEMDLKNFAPRFIDAQGPCFQIIPLLGTSDFTVEIATGMIKPSRGWVSVGGADLPATTCRYSVRGLANSTAIWLLLPYYRVLHDTVETSRTDHANRVEIEVRMRPERRDVITLHPPVLDDRGYVTDFGHEHARLARTRH